MILLHIRTQSRQFLTHRLAQSRGFYNCSTPLREKINIFFPNLSDTPSDPSTATKGSVQKWYVSEGDEIKPNTTVCDIDIPEQFCFGMDLEEGGVILSINKSEKEDCIAGDVICVLDDGLSKSQEEAAKE